MAAERGNGRGEEGWCSQCGLTEAPRVNGSAEARRIWRRSPAGTERGGRGRCGPCRPPRLQLTDEDDDAEDVAPPRLGCRPRRRRWPWIRSVAATTASKRLELRRGEGGEASEWVRGLVG